MKSITGNICNDLENLVNRKSRLPENPTVESARVADEIEKDKETTRDNIYNAVIMTNQARNAIEKSFENVDTNSPDYYNQLNDHAKKLDEIDKIGKSLRNLSENTLSLRKNIVDLTNKIREELGLPGGITGGAANIGNIVKTNLSEFTIDSIFNLFNSLHGVQIKDVRYKNRIIFFRIEDFYNFNKDRPSLKGRIGEKLQNQGDLENYYIIVDIKFKMP